MQEPQCCTKKAMKTTTIPAITLHSGPSLAGLPSDGGLTGPSVYRKLTDEICRLLERKMGYYGCPTDSPLANALAVAEDGIDPVVYQMARVNEKLRRLRGLRRTVDSRRAIRETLCDIAGHAVVALACLGEEE